MTCWWTDATIFGVAAFIGALDANSFGQQQCGAVLDERQMASVVGRTEMKRLRRSLETDEYHLNFVRQKVARA